MTNFISFECCFVDLSLIYLLYCLVASHHQPSAIRITNDTRVNNTSYSHKWLNGSFCFPNKEKKAIVSVYLFCDSSLVVLKNEISRFLMMIVFHSAVILCVVVIKCTNHNLICCMHHKQIDTPRAITVIKLRRKNKQMGKMGRNKWLFWLSNEQYQSMEGWHSRNGIIIELHNNTILSQTKTKMKTTNAFQTDKWTNIAAIEFLPVPVPVLHAYLAVRTTRIGLPNRNS